ncbi:hypothetical protein HZA98_02580 [Candidatus Woesearchaeota archaeon]|nr:hypothetical protein [Candidatus Woesearchaeota archaeon]
MDKNFSRALIYVHKYRERGYSDASIRNALKKGGFSEETISKIFVQGKITLPSEKSEKKKEEIKAVLLQEAPRYESKRNGEVKAVSEGKKEFFLSQKTLFSISLFFLILFIVFVLIFIVEFPRGGCSSNASCQEGYSCSDGNCVSAIGSLHCQYIDNCTDGVSCYKCVQP